MLKFSANPTFTVKNVSVQTTDGPATFDSLTFKHMTEKAWDEYKKGRFTDEAKTSEVILDLVVGWQGVEKEFSKESLAELVDVHPAAANGILAAYIAGLLQGKLGN